MHLLVFVAPLLMNTKYKCVRTKHRQPRSLYALLIALLGSLLSSRTCLLQVVLMVGGTLHSNRVVQADISLEMQMLFYNIIPDATRYT